MTGSMGADPGGDRGHVSTNKNTLNYSELNKCIFRLHILHILDYHLRGND